MNNQTTGGKRPWLPFIVIGALSLGAFLSREFLTGAFLAGVLFTRAIGIIGPGTSGLGGR
jgi:hypothetical protein